MDITKAVSEIRQTFKDGLPESVDSTLTQIRNEFVTMQDSLKMTNEEAKTRRTKNAELLSELETLKDQVSRLSDDTQLKQLQEENTALKQVKEKFQTTTKSKYLERLSQLKDNPNFERIQDKIKLPEIKENKFVPESIGFEDAEISLNKLDEYESLGLFEDAKTKKTLVPKSGPTHMDNDDIDIIELAKRNPKEAEKWLSARNMGHKDFGR